MRISPLILIIAIYFSFIYFAFAADSISMEPGMWEMTSTTTTSMSPQPQTTTENECIDQSEFSADDLVPDDQDQCTITESNVNGNTLSFSMQCAMQGGGSSTGAGQFTSKGDSGSGSMQMTMEFQGQTFNMQTSWEGKRIGSC